MLVWAAGLSTLVSATIGVTSGCLGGVIPVALFAKAWRTWWVGDALGVLVVAPLLFVWSEPGRSMLPRRQLPEALLLLGALGTLSLAIFSPLIDVLLTPLPYLVFPPLISAALRLGPQAPSRRRRWWRPVPSGGRSRAGAPSPTRRSRRISTSSSFL